VGSLQGKSILVTGEEVARRGAAEASIPQRGVSRVGFDAAAKR
jgi:hypothetical protein